MVANGMFGSLCIRFYCRRLNSDSAQSLARLGCTGFPIALGGLPDVRLRGCRPDQGALSKPAIPRRVPLPRQTCLWASRRACFQVCFESSWASVIRGWTSCCTAGHGLDPVLQLFCVSWVQQPDYRWCLYVAGLCSTLLASSTLIVACTHMIQHAHDDSLVVNSAAAVRQYMPIVS